MSEQIICVHPRVSTAVRRRITALRRDIFVTPMDSTSVTTVARPSGIAATARLTATMKVDSSVWPEKSPARSTLNAKMNTHMPSTIQLRILPNWASFRCSGV